MNGFDRTYPQLFSHIVSNESNVSPTTMSCAPSLRPILAYLAMMVSSVWFREITYDSEVHQIVNDVTQRPILASVKLNDVRLAYLDPLRRYDLIYGRLPRDLLEEFADQFRQKKLGSEGGLLPLKKTCSQGQHAFQMNWRIITYGPCFTRLIWFVHVRTNAIRLMEIRR